MFEKDTSVISRFLLFAYILAIYVDLCFYSTKGCAKSTWFYSWCKQCFCMQVCCSSLLFLMRHSHYYSSQLLLICIA